MRTQLLRTRQARERDGAARGIDHGLRHGDQFVCLHDDHGVPKRSSSASSSPVVLDEMPRRRAHLLKPVGDAALTIAHGAGDVIISARGSGLPNTEASPSTCACRPKGIRLQRNDRRGPRRHVRQVGLHGAAQANMREVRWATTMTMAVVVLWGRGGRVPGDEHAHAPLRGGTRAFCPRCKAF